MGVFAELLLVRCSGVVPFDCDVRPLDGLCLLPSLIPCSKNAQPTYEQLKGEAQLGALEGALHAAVRDYKKEMEEAEEQAKEKQKAQNQQEVGNPLPRPGKRAWLNKSLVLGTHMHACMHARTHAHFKPWSVTWAERKSSFMHPARVCPRQRGIQSLNLIAVIVEPPTFAPRSFCRGEMRFDSFPWIQECPLPFAVPPANADHAPSRTCMRERR